MTVARSVVLLALCLILCAWVPKPPRRDINSIGIIAAVGGTCLFEHVSDAAFESIGPPEATFLEISDQGIDDAVTNIVATRLSPRYRVQPITIEHQDFDTWTYESLARYIRGLPVPEAPVDAYLLILRDWRSDEIGGSDHPLAGLGLYRRDFRGSQRYGVFASYRLVLMEPERGGIVASRAALLPDGHLPSLPAASWLWPRTQNNLTGAQRDALHADFLKLINESLPGALKQLGFATK
jgi:hypothetical protein